MKDKCEIVYRRYDCHLRSCIPLNALGKALIIRTLD